MAEQQAEAYKKKQEELRMQYEKEQDLHNNKYVLHRFKVMTFFANKLLGQIIILFIGWIELVRYHIVF